MTPALVRRLLRDRVAQVLDRGSDTFIMDPVWRALGDVHDMDAYEAAFEAINDELDAIVEWLGKGGEQ